MIVCVIYVNPKRIFIVLAAMGLYGIYVLRYFVRMENEKRMKAFQIKMMIKNSKPPIWRRMIVPAGITFSQLSMILNTAMEWGETKSFFFEFYHSELIFIEGVYQREFTSWDFDYIEASTAFIREYLEENEWFSYNCAARDDWSHRVTIEKVLDDYGYDYPQVIKYKGNCPDGDVCNQASYDMEDINRKLKETCIYKWGEGEKRFQKDLYRDWQKGKNGLLATRNDENVDLQIKISTKHQLAESAKMFQEFICQNQQPQSINMFRLNDIFASFEREEILAIANDKGLDFPLSCKKTELINQLAEYMLSTDVFESYFKYLSDEEIAEFEKVGNCEGLYYSDRSNNLERLIQASYIGVIEDGGMEVPDDVWNKYHEISTASFHRKRRINSYVGKCLFLCNEIYGVYPLDVALKVINQKPKQSMTRSELEDIIRMMPYEWSEAFLNEDTLYSNLLHPEEQELLMGLDLPYYIPSYEEIIDHIKHGYFSENQGMKRYYRFLMRKFKLSKERAENVSTFSEYFLSVGMENELLMALEDIGILTDKKKRPEMVREISLLSKDIRMRRNRGYKLNELAGLKNDSKSLPQSKVISFSEARKKRENRRE